MFDFGFDIRTHLLTVLPVRLNDGVFGTNIFDGGERDDDIANYVSVGDFRCESVEIQGQSNRIRHGLIQTGVVCTQTINGVYTETDGGRSSDGGRIVVEVSNVVRDELLNAESLRIDSVLVSNAEYQRIDGESNRFGFQIEFEITNNQYHMR